jgi:hypothetical protein
VRRERWGELALLFAWAAGACIPAELMLSGSDGSGGDAAGGHAGATVIALAQSLDRVEPLVLAAWAGNAYVAAMSTAGESVFRVPLDQGPVDEYTLPLTAAGQVDAIVADAQGVVWGGADGWADAPDGGVEDHSIVGGFDLDGQSPWTITDLYPASAPPYSSSNGVEFLVADAATVWLKMDNGPVLRVQRNCNGTGASCASAAMAEGNAGAACFERSSGSQYLFYVGGAGCLIDGGEEACLRRMPASGTGEGEPFTFIAPVTMNEGTPHCVRRGDDLVMVDLSVRACSSLEGPAPCDPKQVNPPETWMSSEVIATDGTDFYLGGASIVRLHLEDDTFTTLTEPTERAAAIAADGQAVYWLEGDKSYMPTQGFLHALPH